jgi:hypothetical protein
VIVGNFVALAGGGAQDAGQMASIVAGQLGAAVVHTVYEEASTRHGLFRCHRLHGILLWHGLSL